MNTARNSGVGAAFRLRFTTCSYPRNLKLETTGLTLLCLLASQATAQIEPIGLQGNTVHDIDDYGGLLFAVAESGGVFQYQFSQADSGWKSIGLEGKQLWSVYPHKSGPLGFGVTVGTQPSRMGGDTTLLYCSFMASGEWLPSDSGLPRSEVYSIKDIDGFPDPTICGETFAVAGGKVFRRGFTSGSVWSEVFDIGIGSVNVVQVDLQGNRVWIGGETAIFAPFLARSTDAGDNWDMFLPNLGGDNACNSIVVHPLNPDIVYAGMEGAVIKTTDAGSSWSVTGLQGTPDYFYGLELDPSNPDHLYAGGTPSGNTFALYESIDGGAGWQTVVPPSPLPGVSALAVDPGDGSIVYVATLGDGVFRYRSTLTAVQKEANTPLQFDLLQNYPNPFNPVTRICYFLPTDSYVTLKVFNLLGEAVETLAEGELRAGSHQVDFDGSVVPSGMYFYRLTAGTFNQTQKMLLIK